jgi:photosystem II stability/assembly factor-like uncharacterized protein
VRLLALGVLAALVLAGCGESDRRGGDGAAETGASSRLVDLTAEPPFVNALELDERSGELLLTTNKGFFRIDPETDEVTEVRATVSSGRRTSPVGTFLFLYAAGPDRLIGSGHPDDTALPQYLGFIESTDGGETWEVTARLGEADLHKIQIVGDRLYAFDAVLSALLISDDGGKTFEERFTPRGLIIDFAVDPEDPEHILAANETQLFRTEEGGESWRPVLAGEGIRLAWPAPEALYRATADGVIERSSDGGETWEPRSQVEGEPYKFKATGPESLYLALGDGTVLATTDGARTWEPVFEP